MVNHLPPQINWKRLQQVDFSQEVGFGPGDLEWIWHKASLLLSATAKRKAAAKGGMIEINHLQFYKYLEKFMNWFWLGDNV